MKFDPQATYVAGRDLKIDGTVVPEGAPVSVEALGFQVAKCLWKVRHIVPAPVSARPPETKGPPPQAKPKGR
jgi:hypothetical protein